MTTVYRLPEEPPIGTTVMRPEPDTGERYTRDTTAGVANWRIEIGMAFGMPGVAFLGWEQVLKRHPEGLVVVEPDPHPTPWHLDNDDSGCSRIVDANRDSVAYVYLEPGVAQRIVDAVNKATP